ncbi:hypothetical protein ACJMK2_015434 [Sinanodonta woodiana]|uniref:Chitin-binding type-2 domain-containing protein n=1 Tax=Sinanodonta woodiana TaxID=1069815 RepID=A0ABD3UTY4_SINWO
MNMLSAASFILCLAIVLAKQEDEHHPEDKRLQVNCVDAWNLNTNPCTNNPLNKVYFAISGDNSKFIQCGTFGRMFVIQCPAGEVFNQGTSNCVRQQFVSQPAVTPGQGINNPCTSVASGTLFYQYNGDNTKFIECDLQGNANLLTCPSRLVWDQNRLSCVYSAQLAGGGQVVLPGTVVLPGSGSVLLQPGFTGLGTGATVGNPCSAQAISSSQMFFSHPDSTKFIQCDIDGSAFVLTCPSGLVWNQYLETCTFTSGNQVSAGGLIING